TVTVWAHVFELPQGSVADQVCVTANVPSQKPSALVVVLRIARMTFVPLARSVGAAGASKLQSTPDSTDLSAAQTSVGGVVSITVTVWAHVFELPQGSVADQVCVIEYVPSQKPIALVVVLRIASVTFLLLASPACVVGSSKLQSTPASMDLSGA